jgi:uncharacterized protein YjeT (DUF2065 family)
MFMMGMMSDMMPYMKSFLYIANGLILIGLLVILFNWKSLVSGRGGSDLDNAEERGKINILGKSLLGFAAFFLGSEVMAPILGMEAPGFALFANPSQFDFGIGVRFWQVGLLFLVTGLVYLLLSKRSKTTT